MSALRQHDYPTYEHSKRVAKLLYDFGQYLKLSEDTINLLFSLGLYHDIGKINISPGILNKKGKLNDNEFNLIRNHTIFGEEILKEKGFPIDFIQSVRSHHENFDGSGYPDKLTSEEIPFYAQMLRIVDSFDAMTSVRTYKAIQSEESAINEIYSLKGKWYDPELVDEFCKMYSSQQLQNRVK